MSKTKDEDFSVRFSLSCDEKITLYLSGRDVPGEGDVYLKILKSTGSASGNKVSPVSILSTLIIYTLLYSELLPD